jgi:hypothetical protein
MIMKRWNQLLVVAGVAALLCAGTGTGRAQSNNTGGGGTTGGDGGGNNGRRGRGNFDPAQIQQRMLEGVKDRLGFTNETEWAAVQPLVQKVFDARRETMAGGMGRFGGGRPGGGNNGGNATNENRPNAFFKPSPEAESLQKLIDDKVPAAELKDALEKYRASRKDKEAKLAAAQEDLRKVLTVRQEAQASLLGLVP